MKHVEIENQRIAQNNSQQDSVKDLGAAKGKAPAGKADPKKDPKSAAGKPATADDKNCPKDIKVDYPEVEQETDFMILEKSYKDMKPAPKTTVNKSKKAETANTVPSTAGS